MSNGHGALLPASAVLVAGLAACGTASSSSSSPTGVATATPSPSSLFSPGATTSAAPTPPLLDVTQFGFHMTLAPALGGVSYSIDRSHSGTVHDADGTMASFEGSVNLATPTYAAAACASSFPAEASIDVYTTGASSLRFISGPDQWVRAGPHLLGFRPPQNEPCQVAQFQHDLPLLRQTFATATAD